MLNATDIKVGDIIVWVKSVPSYQKVTKVSPKSFECEPLEGSQVLWAKRIKYDETYDFRISNEVAEKEIANLKERLLREEDKRKREKQEKEAKLGAYMRSLTDEQLAKIYIRVRCSYDLNYNVIDGYYY